MKHLLGTIQRRGTVENICGENFNILSDVIDRTISEAAFEHLNCLFASGRAMIEMPAAWSKYRDRSQPSGETFNPLDIYLVIEPESEDSYEEPVAFQTSLKEILSPQIKLCEKFPSRLHGGMEGIADALRELADEIDKSLSRKTKHAEITS